MENCEDNIKNILGNAKSGCAGWKIHTPSASLKYLRQNLTWPFRTEKVFFLYSWILKETWLKIMNTTLRPVFPRPTKRLLNYIKVGIVLFGGGEKSRGKYLSWEEMVPDLLREGEGDFCLVVYYVSWVDFYPRAWKFYYLWEIIYKSRTKKRIVENNAGWHSNGTKEKSDIEIREKEMPGKWISSPSSSFANKVFSLLNAQQTVPGSICTMPVCFMHVSTSILLSQSHGHYRSESYKKNITWDFKVPFRARSLWDDILFIGSS